ncbi:MAG: glutaredoxin family protein [Candidatus Dormibacteraceae bacterium]
MRIELISRAGCGLCEEARGTLAALGLTFQERDVDREFDLYTRYTDRVPVLLLDGAVAGEGRLRAADVARAVGR